MKLKGKDLIVSADGNVIAAAKTCTINVEAEDIGISTPRTGKWKACIGGEKSWSVSTNHLLPNPYPSRLLSRAYTIEGVSAAWGSGMRYATARVGTRELITPEGQRGIFVFDYYREEEAWTTERYHYDNYEDSTQTAEIIDLLGSLGNEEAETVVIVTYDAFYLPQNLREAIASALAIDINTIPVIGDTDNPHAAMVCIGQPQNPSAVGTCVATVGNASEAHAFAVMTDTDYTIYPVATPIKDAAAMVGRKFTLTVRTLGLNTDVLTGTGLCTQFKLDGNLSNLLKGSFKWEGDGALE